MIYLSLADLAKIRRRQEIHAKELADAGLAKIEYDNEEEPTQEQDEKGEKI